MVRGYFCCCLAGSNSFATLWALARQAPPSTEFSRQEYWRELPFPSPGALPHPGIKPTSPALVGVLFTIEPSQKPQRPSLVYLKCLPANILRNLNLCLLHSVWDIRIRVLIASLMTYMNLEDLLTLPLGLKFLICEKKLLRCLLCFISLKSFASVILPYPVITFFLIKKR